MATAKRRINSTDRKRISQEVVDIRLLETPPGTPARATAQLDLAKFEFPNSAGVAIEAYRSSSLMRFDCGTIGHLEIPPVLILDEIDSGGNVQFRVKVVDRDEQEGRLLGSASRIRPRSSEDQDGRRTLLPIIWDDLGSEMWGVSVGDQDPPALKLNLRATGLDARILDDPMLRGVIMPAAFRRVLEELVLHLPVDDEDETDWKNEWLRFCSEQLAVDDDPAELSVEEREEWIEEVVQAFAARAGFLEKVRKAADGGVG